MLFLLWFSTTVGASGIYSGKLFIAIKMFLSESDIYLSESDICFI